MQDLALLQGVVRCSKLTKECARSNIKRAPTHPWCRKVEGVPGKQEYLSTTVMVFKYKKAKSKLFHKTKFGPAGGLSQGQVLL